MDLLEGGEALPGVQEVEEIDMESEQGCEVEWD